MSHVHDSCPPILGMVPSILRQELIVIFFIFFLKMLFANTCTHYSQKKKKKRSAFVGYLISSVGINKFVSIHHLESNFKSESVSHFKSCLTLCNSMDCSLPGSSVLGIFQARILEWVASLSTQFYSVVFWCCFFFFFFFLLLFWYIF